MVTELPLAPDAPRVVGLVAPASVEWLELAAAEILAEFGFRRVRADDPRAVQLVDMAQRTGGRVVLEGLASPALVEIMRRHVMGFELWQIEPRLPAHVPDLGAPDRVLENPGCLDAFEAAVLQSILG